MRYGDRYKTYELSPKFIDAVENFARDQPREVATIEDSGGMTRRKSRVVWIDDSWLVSAALEIAKVANREARWDFDLDFAESLQYTEYYGGDEYSWHTDQARTPYEDGRVRKVSFSIYLNDDFDGGEFDLDLFGPQHDPRYFTFTKLKPGTGVFFQSDVWHRVRPVTRGVRTTLVGWIRGTKFR